MDALQNANVVGPVYDGVGVCMLGLPSLLTSTKEIGLESGTYWDGNNALLRRLVLNKLDTTAGSFMLIVGFVLQLLATLKVSLNPTIAVMLWIALAVLPLAYFYAWRTRLLTRYMKQASSDRGISSA